MHEREATLPHIRLLTGTFVFTLFFTLFFSYPEAVFPPDFFTFPEKSPGYSAFARSVPSIEILAPPAAAIILLIRPVGGFPFFVAFSTIAVSILLHSIFSQVSLEESLRFSGIVLIPFATIILYQKKIIRLKSLSTAFSLLWIHQIFSGFFYIKIHESVIGISGNKNWMAALLLATCPWASYRLYRLTPLRWLPVYRFFLTGMLTVLPTLTLMGYCESRGAWLALFLLPLFSYCLFLKSNRKKIIFLLTLLFIALISIYTAVTFLPKDSILPITEDVRVPIGKAVLNMLKEHPLGVGPGNFQKYLPPYRAEAGYAESRNATDSTIHPHNEPLNIAASIGIPGMLAFIFLVFHIVVRKEDECAMLFLARCSAFTLFFHSLFDLILVQMPCSLIALICLGISLSNTKGRTRLIPPAPGPPLLWISIAAALSVFVFVRDAIFDHLIIRAHDQTASGRAALAYTSLLDAAKLKPGSTETLYQAAGILKLTELPEKEAVAAKLYKKIYKQDPFYSHVNLALGLDFLRTGNFMEAENHLRKEAMLFPLSLDSFSGIYNLYYKTGNFTRMRTANKELVNTLLRKNTIYVSKKELAGLISGWVSMTEKGDSSNAIKKAKRLSRYIPHNSADPALNEMTKLVSWPDFEKNGVNALDFFYWNSRIKMYDWIDKNGIRDNGLLYFLRRFKKKFKITSDINYEPPGVAWDKKRINPVAAVHLFTELSRMTGGEVILEKGEKNNGTIHILYKGKYHSLSFPEWDSYTQLTSPPAISWQPDRTFLFLPIQSFYLRTRLFQALLKKYMREKRFLASGFPGITIANAMEIFPPEQAADRRKLSDYLFREELYYVIKRLR